MLRIFGAFLLLAGCASVGVLQVKRLDSRVKALQSFLPALEIMEREMDFRLPAMEELIDITSRSVSGPAAEFLHICADELNNEIGKPFSEIWFHAAKECLPVLQPSEMECLLALGHVLGRYDGDGQRQMIGRTRVRMEEYLAAAKNERGSQGKVYHSVGIAAGALLVILLL